MVRLVSFPRRTDREVGSGFQAAADFSLGAYAGRSPAAAWKGRPHKVRPRSCDATIYHMETVSIRDLRYRFPKVQRLLERGEAVQITKRKRVIGTLTPAEPSPPANPPDFLARARKIWKKPFPVSTAELLERERDRY
jgi:antitoxin (DNA-binding transcriptional repressor) of toxin-antitoxin stability system